MNDDKKVLEYAAYIVEELIDLYDAARDHDLDNLPTKPGAPFEKRVRVVGEMIARMGINSDFPVIPRD